MTRILVISLGPVGSRIAAPGIRALNVARVLHEQVPDAEVTLALPPGPTSDIDQTTVPFRVVRAPMRDLVKLAASQDIIISGIIPAALLPLSLRSRIVLDLYSPLVTEWANMSRWLGHRHRRAMLEAKRKHLMMELTAADLVLCANERQRDFVAGIMGTLGMITPQQFEEDPGLVRRIPIAPLGIRPHEPQPRTPVLRGVLPGIGKNDLILLWNGTIIEWYDVDTLLRAVHKLCQERSDIKLVFLGTAYPQPKAGVESKGIGAGAVQSAIELATKLGLLGTHVFFNHGWADAAMTEQSLQEADLGVSTYFDNLETHFSFRVRYLDLFWASLPIICTQGDVVSEMVAQRGLGAAVPARNVDALVDAIRRLAVPAERARCRENLKQVREEFRWERTLAPLIAFCRNPGSHRGDKLGRGFPLAWRGADWFVSEAHEKLRFAYRKKLLRSGHSGLD